MVKVEAISLETDVTSEDSRTVQKKKTIKKRDKIALPSQDDTPRTKQRCKVHFLSLNGSSMRPPSDRDLQSGIRQRQSIEAMIHAKEVIEGLTTDALSSLQALQTFLDHLFTPSSECENGIIQLCAGSISNEYPNTSIFATIDLIRQDLIVLLERLLSSTIAVSTENDDAVEATKSLQLEICLAVHLGQAIRYQLRVLFNPSPPRLCRLDTGYENRSLEYSKVYQLMTMNKRTTGEDDGLAIDDGFLSALVSRALRRLYEYFGLEHLIPVSDDDIHVSFKSVIPDNFCTSEPSHRQIPLRIRATSQNDEITVLDRDQVVIDLQQATSFLSASYAARFLCDVFTTPGVQEEVRRMGGWQSIEQYSLTSKKYHLYESCPADAHLVPLCDYLSLLERLQKICEYMEPKIPSCVNALQMVASNYRIPDVTTPAKSQRKMHQYLKQIVDTYNELMKEANAFPQIKMEPPPPTDSN
jgi:hypothetical protein